MAEQQEPPSTPAPTEAERRILIDAAKQVGPALFFSLLIIVVSFLPVFLLEAQEGRMFRPLAWTKTLAVGFSSILAITLVPVLMVMFIRGGCGRSPKIRFRASPRLCICRCCAFACAIADSTLLAESGFPCAVTFRLVFRWAANSCRRSIRRLCAVHADGASRHLHCQASTLLQEQDRIIRSFPEVESVFGAVGRSDSATDNAPLDMYDTTVMLKPREQWPPGMTYEKLIQEMDGKLQFPGLSNTWTMPVENRLDMALTGIKTPVGMKIQGPNVDGIQQPGVQIQQVLSALPGVRSDLCRACIAGFLRQCRSQSPGSCSIWLTIADVQRAVASGIGGKNIAENIEGRERYPINVRYERDFRDNLDELGAVLIATPSGAQIPHQARWRRSPSRAARP